MLASHEVVASSLTTAFQESRSQNKVCKCFSVIAIVRKARAAAVVKMDKSNFQPQIIVYLGHKPPSVNQPSERLWLIRGLADQDP